MPTKFLVLDHAVALVGTFCCFLLPQDRLWSCPIISTVTVTSKVSMCVPKCFWAYAVITICHLINRVPSFVLYGKIPSQIFILKNNCLIYLQRFLRACVLFKFSKKHDKLDPQAVRCVFLTFSNTKTISMLEFCQQEICDLCRCWFLWKTHLTFESF